MQLSRHLTGIFVGAVVAFSGGAVRAGDYADKAADGRSRIRLNQRRASDVVDLIQNDSDLRNKFAVHEQHITNSRGLVLFVPIKHLRYDLPDKKLAKLRRNEVDLLISGYKGRIKRVKDRDRFYNLLRIARCNNDTVKLYRTLEKYSGKVVVGCEGFPYGSYSTSTSKCVRQNQETLALIRLIDKQVKENGLKPDRSHKLNKTSFLVHLNLILPTTNYEITNGPLQSFGLENGGTFTRAMTRMKEDGLDSAIQYVFDRRNKEIAGNIIRAFKDYNADIVVCPIGMDHLNNRITTSLKEHFEKSRYNQSYIVLEPRAFTARIAELSPR